MGLRVAVVGYNFELSCRIVREIARNDQVSIAKIERDKVLMADGTVYQAVSSHHMNRLDGLRFDQMIIADDDRWMVYDQQAELIHRIKCLMGYWTCVPDSFAVQEFPYV